MTDTDTLPATTVRRDRLRQMIADHSLDASCEPDVLLTRPRRYVLVERSTITGLHSMCTFKTPGYAAAAWADQERVDDWEPLLLVDLDTGDRFGAELSIEWVEHPAGAYPFLTERRRQARVFDCPAGAISGQHSWSIAPGEACGVCGITHAQAEREATRAAHRPS